jgi:hypothetical protein
MSLAAGRPTEQTLFDHLKENRGLFHTGGGQEPDRKIRRFIHEYSN